MVHKLTVIFILSAARSMQQLNGIDILIHTRCYIYRFHLIGPSNYKKNLQRAIIKHQGSERMWNSTRQSALQLICPCQGQVGSAFVIIWRRFSHNLLNFSQNSDYPAVLLDDEKTHTMWQQINLYAKSVQISALEEANRFWLLQLDAYFFVMQWLGVFSVCWRRC